MERSMTVRILAVCVLTIVVVGAFWTLLNQNANGSQGTIKVSGAFALYPMMVKWAEEFQKVNPNVKVDVSAGGAGKGMTDALSGLVDIGMISRGITAEEVSKGAFYIPVAKDAVFPVISASNPVVDDILEVGVKKSSFIDMWINGKSMTWGDIAGSSSEAVNVYTRSDSCGAAEMWAKYLGNKTQADLKGVGVYGDPGLDEAVKNDRDGIGYSNLNFAYDMNTSLPVAGLQVVPIDINGNGVVDASEDLSTKEKAIAAIKSGEYPSPPARLEYLATKGNFTGVTKEFVHWILTDGQKYVEEVGYVKLSDAQISDALIKVGED